MQPRNRGFGSITHYLLILTFLVSDVWAQDTKLPALTDTADDRTATSSVSSLSPSRTATISTSISTQDVSTTSKISQSTKTTSTSPSTSTSTSEAAQSDLPALTSSGPDGLLTGLPKLPGDDYPAPTVPPTANAPFMQKSNLPEGTVFICVGAVLGFMALVVIAWRSLVAWSLHRSVRRAALAQSAKYNGGGRGVKMTQASHRTSKAHFYNPGPGSTLSLDQLGTTGRVGHRTTTARESLFFSPTAGAGMQSQGTRNSGYLPAGYYAAGNSAAGGGAGMTHMGESSASLSNLTQAQHQNHRYSRARSSGPSPPASPSLPPSSRGAEINGPVGFRRPSTAGGLTIQGSQSTLNLSMAPQSRAPSAYLEELFEKHRSGSWGVRSWKDGFGGGGSDWIYRVREMGGGGGIGGKRRAARG